MKQECYRTVILIYLYCSLASGQKYNLLQLVSFVMSVAWWMFTDVSEKYAASIFYPGNGHSMFLTNACEHLPSYSV
jgi:hypothetical protein